MTAYHRQANPRMQSLLRVRAYKDAEISRDLNGKAHKFVVFRLGLDECAKCGKSRKEHLRAEKCR